MEASFTVEAKYLYNIHTSEMEASFYKGMYNGAILGVPPRMNDEVEEKELIRKGLPSLI